MRDWLSRRRKLIVLWMWRTVTREREREGETIGWMIFERKCDWTAVKTGARVNPGPTGWLGQDSTVGNVINAAVARDVSKSEQLIRHQRVRARWNGRNF